MSLNIIMVSYMDFSGPGVIHMFHFANRLVKQGHRVLMLLNGEPSTVVSIEDEPLFSISRISFRGNTLHPRLLRTIRRFKPHLVHIWTPRNVPARVGLEIKQCTRARLLIHYEDDEEVLVKENGRELFQILDYAVETFIEPEKWVWIHPFTFHLANGYADRLTSISTDYCSYLKQRWQLPVDLLIPGVDLSLFHPQRPRKPDLMKRFKLQGKKVLLYGGSIAQFYDFHTILQAFQRVAEDHPHLDLLQYGRNFMASEVNEFLITNGLHDRVHLAGPIPHSQVPDYLALGDIYLQPGGDTRFNRHRLPSKLPEYLAMGRPVITFSCGIGKELTHGTNAYLLQSNEPAEMAEAISRCLKDEKLYRTLSLGGRRRATELFDWERSTAELVRIYEKSLLFPREKPGYMTPLGIKLLGRELRETFGINGSRKVAAINQEELFEELLGLREFHRKVTSTVLYKLYLHTKLLLANLQSQFK